MPLCYIDYGSHDGAAGIDENSSFECSPLKEPSEFESMELIVARRVRVKSNAFCEFREIARDKKKEKKKGGEGTQRMNESLVENQIARDATSLCHKSAPFACRCRTFIVA